MILFQEPIVFVRVWDACDMCGCVLRRARVVWGVLVFFFAAHIFAVVTIAGSGGVACASHSSGTERSGFDEHHGLQAHSVAPACYFEQVAKRGLSPTAELCCGVGGRWFDKQ